MYLDKLDQIKIVFILDNTTDNYLDTRYKITLDYSSEQSIQITITR